MATKTNLAPADRLAKVRDEIRILKAEEDELRSGFIDGELDAVGDEHVVVITTSRSERIDTQALKREWGMAKLRPFVTESETTFVKLKKRADGR